MKKFLFHRGNMAEYILPAGLIGLVAVAGLSWSLSGQFAAQGGRSLFQAETSQVGQNGKALLNSRSFGKNPYLQTYTLTLANGKTIQIPDMPVSVADNIDVDGGHGTTEKLLAAMEKLRQALVESGELTEADSQPFKDLANAGHGFGESQAFMEKIMQTCGQDKKCVADRIYQNGMNVEIMFNSGFASAQNALGNYSLSSTARALTEQELGILDTLAPNFREKINQDPYFNKDIRNMRVGSNFAKFVNSFQQVMDLPSVKGTSTAGFVQNLASNILNLQRASYNSSNKIANNLAFRERQQGVAENQGTWVSATPEKYLQELKGHFKAHSPHLQNGNAFSDLTHSQSGVICTTGKGSDTGQQCQ
jgi:hypothetical protein